jgi:hypothetical protein
MTAVRWKEGGNFYLQVPPKGQLRVLDTWDDSMHKVEVRGTWQRMHAACDTGLRSLLLNFLLHQQHPGQFAPAPLGFCHLLVVALALPVSVFAGAGAAGARDAAGCRNKGRCVKGCRSSGHRVKGCCTAGCCSKAYCTAGCHSKARRATGCSTASCAAGYCTPATGTAGCRTTSCRSPGCSSSCDTS